MAGQYEVHLKGVGSGIKAGNIVEVESTTIRNPVNGNEAHPGIVLPEGIIVAVGPFDYVFP